jgi:cysteine sulfinate desulfinase/cysteine desulfurase-like protein
MIETARAQVAELIAAQPREIIFTSCATESNNAAIHAALKANPGKRHIVTSAVEHSSVLYQCDAIQATGKVTIDVSRDGEMQADYLSLTGHKFHAPKGIGALYVRRNAPFSPLIHGGHQERSLRGYPEAPLRLP